MFRYVYEIAPIDFFDGHCQSGSILTVLYLNYHGIGIYY